MIESKGDSNFSKGSEKPEGLSVPQGYFDDLHDRIMSKVTASNAKSILDSDHLRQNIFKVPDGYFDQLEKNIQKEQKREARIIPIYQKNWFRYAAAAVTLVVVFLLGLKSDDGMSDELLTNLSNEAIIEYLSDEDISSLDILASIDESINMLDQFVEDEMSTFDISDYGNPELEYDFEYIEY